MVLVLYAHSRVHYLSEVEVQLGAAVLIDNVHCVSIGDIIESRDARQNSYARTAKYMVRTARYCLYVLIRSIGCLFHFISLWSYDI